MNKDHHYQGLKSNELISLLENDTTCSFEEMEEFIHELQDTTYSPFQSIQKKSKVDVPAFEYSFKLPLPITRELVLLNVETEKRILESIENLLSHDNFPLKTCCVCDELVKKVETISYDNLSDSIIHTQMKRHLVHQLFCRVSCFRFFQRTYTKTLKITMTNPTNQNYLQTYV